MRLISQFVAGASCALLVSLAQATQFSYSVSIRVDNIYEFTGQSLTGTPTSTAFPLGGPVSIGDTLTGTFSFDQDKLDLPPAHQDQTSRYFTDVNGSAHSLSFTTPGGASFSSATPLDQGVVQLEHGSYDYFSISNFGSPLTTSLVLANWDGGAFHSLDLPSDMKISDFSYTWFRTSWWTGTGQQIDVDGTVVALNAIPNTSAVPEPATWTMLLLGLAGLACLRRAARRDR